MILKVAREIKTMLCHNLFFRILRWLRDEEEQQQEQKLTKIEFLIVELSRKNTAELFISNKAIFSYKLQAVIEKIVLTLNSCN